MTDLRAKTKQNRKRKSDDLTSVGARHLAGVLQPYMAVWSTSDDGEETRTPVHKSPGSGFTAPGKCI